MTDDDLDAAFRGYFAREMAGLDAAPAEPRTPPRPAGRSLATLAVAGGLGLALMLTLPSPIGPRGDRVTQPDRFRNATADGSRLKPAAPAAEPKPPR